MTKSPDAFRTISEVADDLDLPQHVLRFWETRFSQIKPLKRGGGRRYYRPDDVLLLRGIKHLLYGEGYTIKGVQRILREQGLRHVMGLWRDDVSEPETSGEGSKRGHEAYAPKPDRPRGLEPIDSEEQGPAAYARSPTARRPNFEPIVDDEADEDEDAEEEEEEEEEVEDAEDTEAEDDEAEDGDEEEEDEEEDEDETEDSDEDEEDDESEDEEDEDEDEEEAEEEPAGLSAEDRKKLEQTLRELTELRHVLDGNA
jgi:DNA-binding transcriptional MerR regulator